MPLTNQHPAIQPAVPIALIEPNCLCECTNLEKTIEFVKLFVGTLNNDCIWTNAKISQPLHP
jgi:hypothetical protein